MIDNTQSSNSRGQSFGSAGWRTQDKSAKLPASQPLQTGTDNQIISTKSGVIASGKSDVREPKDLNTKATTSATKPSINIPQTDSFGNPLNPDPLSHSSSLGLNRFPRTESPLTNPVPKNPHEENLKILKEKLGEDRIKENELMSKHTTFRIGGPAEFYFEAETIEDLIRVISVCREDEYLKKKEDVTEEDKKRTEDLEKQKSLTEKPKPKSSPYGMGSSPFGGSRFGAKKEPKYQLPFFILGGGSNILVSDKGISGLTIKVKAMKVNFGGEIVEAYAGTPTGYLLQKVLDANLTGMEFLDGVPGTIGGAIYNNAKSFFLGNFLKQPKSIFEIIYDFTVMTKEGKVLIKNVKDYDWSLTHNDIAEKGDIILVTRLKLHKGLTPEAEKYLTDYHDFRRGKPYMKYPTAGSIFRNPEGVSAGKLIDSCGLKGEKHGAAQISPEHGNIIINLGGAKAQDVRILIELCQKKVSERFNLELKEEIRYIGDFRTEQEMTEIKQKMETEEKKEKDEKSLEKQEQPTKNGLGGDW